MPTIYPENNIYSYNGPAAGWSNIRGASSASAVSYNPVNFSHGAAAFAFSGRGSTQYRVHRSFFHFDTSGITDTLSNVTLKIYFYADQGDGNIIVVKSDAFTSSTHSTGWDFDDFNNLDFSNPYSGEVDTTSAGLTSITLNTAAATDIKNNDDFKFAIINYDYDYSNTAPTSTNNLVGIRYKNYSGTSSDPQIDYTVAVVTGYPNTINFVNSSNIGKVNFVSSEDIEKINGV